jgi:transcriptional regulator of arginine metabolism
MNQYRKRSSRQRHQAIVQLIRSRPVRSQEELRQLLRQLGFVVAQPTLSRDVRELGLAKTPRGYVAPDAAVAQFAPAAMRHAKLDRALRSLALSVQVAGALIVVKTPPAAAQPVARALDEAPLTGVAGTIAGDDTVFVATPSERVARALARRLMMALGKGISEEVGA